MKAGSICRTGFQATSCAYIPSSSSPALWCSSATRLTFLISTLPGETIWMDANGETARDGIGASIAQITP
jgi:hypothetical protein